MTVLSSELSSMYQSPPVAHSLSTAPVPSHLSRVGRRELTDSSRLHHAARAKAHHAGTGTGSASCRHVGSVAKTHCLVETDPGHHDRREDKEPQQLTAKGCGHKARRGHRPDDHASAVAPHRMPTILASTTGSAPTFGRCTVTTRCA